MPALRPQSTPSTLHGSPFCETCGVRAKHGERATKTGRRDRPLKQWTQYEKTATTAPSVATIATTKTRTAKSDWPHFSARAASEHVGHTRAWLMVLLEYLANRYWIEFAYVDCFCMRNATVLGPHLGYAYYVYIYICIVYVSDIWSIAWKKIPVLSVLAIIDWFAGQQLAESCYIGNHGFTNLSY